MKRTVEKLGELLSCLLSPSLQLTDNFSKDGCEGESLHNRPPVQGHFVLLLREPEEANKEQQQQNYGFGDKKHFQLYITFF